MENDTEVPQKAEKRATIFSSNSTRSKEIRNINPENICTSILITALVTIAEEWKQSINRKRKCGIQWNITQAFEKKNEILPFATMWMNLQGIILSEISQKEKDR